MTRVWLAGSRAFGTAALDLLRGLPSVCVVAVTAPVGDSLTDAAREAGLLVYHKMEATWVKTLDTDIIVSAQNYVHIPDEARAAAQYGAIGYHPSLLPRWRGRNAVVAIIESGDSIAGGTIYLMDEGWDTGPIITQGVCHVVPGWTAKDLWREALFPLGLRLLRQVLERQSYLWDLDPQDERVATTC